MFDSGFVGLMLQGIAETLYMTIAATAASYLLVCLWALCST